MAQSSARIYVGPFSGEAFAARVAKPVWPSGIGGIPSSMTSTVFAVTQMGKLKETLASEFGVLTGSVKFALPSEVRSTPGACGAPPLLSLYKVTVAVRAAVVEELDTATSAQVIFTA